MGAELQAARARLDELGRAGQADRIGTAAPPSERTTLRNGMATLAEREAVLRALKVQHVEAKSAGRATGGIAARLEAAALSHANLQEVVERQQTIKGLWVPATPAFKRAATQVSTLAAQLEMLGREP